MFRHAEMRWLVKASTIQREVCGREVLFWLGNSLAEGEPCSIAVIFLALLVSLLAAVRSG